MKWLTKEKLDMRWLWAATVAYLAMLVVNGLAGSTTILGGRNTADVSDSYENLFAPAGVTFLIWAVIYVLLAGFLLYAFGVFKTKKPKMAPKQLSKILKLFLASSVLNGLWLFTWQYDFISMSVVLMLGLLTALILINKLTHESNLTVAENLAIRLPFSVYFGWITVATIANITVWLVSLNWNGFGLSDGTWMVAILLVGAVIALANSMKNRDVAYLAVVVWAYAGILVKHLADDGFNGAYPSTVVTLVILLAVFIASGLQSARENALQRR